MKLGTDGVKGTLFIYTVALRRKTAIRIQDFFFFKKNRPLFCNFQIMLLLICNNYKLKMRNLQRNSLFHIRV